jgi:hypothetical protein
MAYTKIGRQVTCTGQIDVSSVSSPVGSYVTVSNLPFTLMTGTEVDERAGFAVVFADSSTGTRALQPCEYLSGTSFVIRIDASTIDAGDDFFFSFSYFTN